MHIPRLLLAVTLTVGAFSLTASSSNAQGMATTFRNFIDAVNTRDVNQVRPFLDDTFTLTFTGGTSVTGTEAEQMLMLLDAPIVIVSVRPAGGGSGQAVLQFGDAASHYGVEYTGAMARIASLTIFGEVDPR